jgi:LacI family transcriptional regulator
MTLAAEHLIRLGHQRMAFVGGARRVSPTRDRTEAFRAVLPRFGPPIGPIVNCLTTREGGAAAGGELIPDRMNGPTAVVCHNDLCALGVTLGLASLGLKPGRTRPSWASTTSRRARCVGPR